MNLYVTHDEVWEIMRQLPSTVYSSISLPDYKPRPLSFFPPKNGKTY